MFYDPDKVADIVANLRTAFLEEANDKVVQMTMLCNEAQTADGAGDEQVRALRRELHSLKGQGTAIGFASITALSHSLEDRLESVAPGAVWDVEPVLRYLEQMDTIIESGIEPDEADVARMLSDLAAQPDAHFTGKAVSGSPNSQIMLVCNSRTIRFKAMREIERLGFEVASFADPFQSLAHAVRARPACVLCWATLDGISGVDLIHALRAMSVTQAIPAVLLTSFGPGHPSMASLPDSVPVVQLDTQMGEGIGRAFNDLDVQAPGQAPGSADNPSSR